MTRAALIGAATVRERFPQKAQNQAVKALVLSRAAPEDRLPLASSADETSASPLFLEWRS